MTALYDVAGGVGPSIISILPAAATGASGAETSATFAVSASGTSPLAYQWYFNTVSNYNGSALANNATNYTIVTAASLTITNLISADSGWYYAVVTNDYGLATSSLASLTILPPVNTTPTNITFSVEGTNLVLNWPADHVGWTLEVQTDSLSAGVNTNWTTVNGSTSTNQVVIPINLTNGCVFYRLAYP